MTTTKGTIQKTPLKDYANIRTNGLIAIKLDVVMNCVGSKRQMARAISSSRPLQDKGHSFNESDARPMGRSARGVRGVRLRPNDSVVGMDVVTSDDQTLLVMVKRLW